MFAPSCCPPFQSLNAHVLSATSTRPTHHHPHHTRTPRAVIMCHSQARTSICSKWMMRTYVPPSRRHANTSASEERSKALSTHFTFHDPNFHPRCIRNQTVFIKMIGAGSFKPPCMHTACTTRIRRAGPAALLNRPSLHLAQSRSSALERCIATPTSYRCTAVVF
jgi:hypothetical protein